MKIDYTYTHGKSCELMTWLEGFLESDKNEAIFEDFSNLMTKLENRPIHVVSPFWKQSKAEIIKWYIDRGLPLTELYKTISCYAAGEKSNYCGACPSCFRKWVAFRSNGLELPFKDVDIVKQYYNAAKSGKYTDKRNKATIEVIERDFHEDCC